ncbi:MAG: DUF4258 domain-containing protein [Chloroflexi bacterium]|nr:DUF4258 domain-containing protein [Chloroflexota bacterium]
MQEPEILSNPLPVIQKLKHESRLLYNGHALVRMFQRELTTEQVEAALNSREAEVIRNYPASGRPSAECLILGQDQAGKRLHILVAYPKAEVVTVYEPTPPRWATPRERGR